MFCTKCGNQIADESKFCTNCGTPTSAEKDPKHPTSVDQTPFGWYQISWHKYFDFKSRSRRKEFWYFILFNALVTLGCSIVDRYIGFDIDVFTWLYFIAAMVPGTSVCVRRLHDIGNSGWWLLVGFVPIVGAIILLIKFLKISESGANIYGENPREADIIE